MVVMEFGDLEERKRSRKSKHQAGNNMIREESDLSSDGISLADIDAHL